MEDQALGKKLFAHMSVVYFDQFSGAACRFQIFSFQIFYFFSDEKEEKLLKNCVFSQFRKAVFNLLPTLVNSMKGSPIFLIWYPLVRRQLSDHLLWYITWSSWILYNTHKKNIIYSKMEDPNLDQLGCCNCQLIASLAVAISSLRLACLNVHLIKLPSFGLIWGW